jgi:phosphoribosylanthranilate isomerase
MKAKICGVKDEKTLRFILDHKYPPNFIGFISNFPKSKRFIEIDKLKYLTNINRKNVKFVAVLVDPSDEILEKIKNFNFDYYQLYDVSPERTKIIRTKYKKKIITALTIKDKKDVNKYKDYLSISDIFLFDGKGYEKSIGFQHSLLEDLPNNIEKMIAGDIKYDDNLDNFKKIANIIDLSGSLETEDNKDLKKIDIFLNNLKELNAQN